MPPKDDLYQKQKDREIEALKTAAERYIEAQRDTIATSGASSLTSYQKLISGALPGTVEALDAWVQDCLEAKGKKPMGLLPIRTLGLEKVALIGLTSSIDAVFTQWDARRVAQEIGTIIQAELWTQELFEADKKTWGRLFEKIRKEHSRPQRRLSKTRHLSEKEWRKWDPVKTLRVGMAVLNAVLIGSALVECDPVSDRRHLTLTPEVREWVQDQDNRLMYSRPITEPMVCPPRPWRGLSQGPFVTKAMNQKFDLVRTNSGKAKRALREACKEGTMQKTLDAVNAISATPWRINEQVLEAVKWVWESRLAPEGDQFAGLEKFPRSSLLDMPPSLDDDEDATDQEKRRRRGQRWMVSQRNRESEAGALGFMRDLSTAEDLLQYERFYLPHNLDFRGRIYPIPHFNQQRVDYVKGMLEFAEAKPLGHKGAYWLAIHLANCGDFDKISKRPLRERYNWVQDNSRLIKDIASDYQTNLTWLDADKPFQFLQACFEWAGYLGQGPSYRSRCAVALDGTNSGLQHYSAALRAEQDAFYVNLRDTEEGQDIYRAVAERTTALVQDALDRGDLEEEGAEHARQWLDHGISRKTVKRSVMTFPYSSEQFGFADQLREDLMRPYSRMIHEGRLTEHPFGEDGGYRASTFLAKYIWIAVNQVVARAGEGMSYLKRISGVLAHEKQPVTWTTPTGLPVLHDYREFEETRVSLNIYDRKILTTGEPQGAPEFGFSRVQYLMRLKPSDRINKSKQRSAVAPNVIHSMDAAHMMLTALQAQSEGITDFSFIHDSFATHAADTDRFFLIIREAFASMYENYDVFGVIDDYAREVLSEEGRSRLPPQPSKGSLDLNEVIRSQFAFS